MTTIDQTKEAVRHWLRKALGKEHIFKIVFDSDFVAGNLINASFNAEPIEPVAFDTDHDTTLAKLASNIQNTAAIFRCIVSGPLELTCQGALKGHEVIIIGPSVTEGETQAVAATELVQEHELIEVIESQQASGRPEKTCAVYSAGVNRALGLRDPFFGYENDGAGELMQMGGMRMITFNVQIIGPDAVQYATEARQSLNFQSVLDAFYDNYEMAVVRTEPVQNITQLLETIWEERASFDVIFSYSENYLEEIPIIKSVEIAAVDLV